jgi:ribosomal protein L7/L12
MYKYRVTTYSNDGRRMDGSLVNATMAYAFLTGTNLITAKKLVEQLPNHLDFVVTVSMEFSRAEINKFLTERDIAWPNLATYIDYIGTEAQKDGTTEVQKDGTTEAQKDGSMHRYHVILTKNPEANWSGGIGKIEAIKAYRFLTGMSLQESKNIIERNSNCHDFVVESPLNFTYDQITEYVKKQNSYNPSYLTTVNKLAPKVETVEQVKSSLKIVQNGSTYSVEINTPNLVIRGDFPLRR